MRQQATQPRPRAVLPLPGRSSSGRGSGIQELQAVQA